MLRTHKLLQYLGFPLPFDANDVDGDACRNDGTAHTGLHWAGVQRNDY